VLVDFSDQQRGLLAVHQIWRDLFLDVSLVSVIFCGGAGAGARWVLWSEDVDPEVVDLSLFSYFMGGMRWFLVQGSTGTSPGQLATATCASLLAAGLFIDSQSLVGDGAFLDLAMEEARRLFQHASWRRWSVGAAASFGESRKA
jgi:hypothetical protein